MIGLKNRGNTCYLNTSIQCLYNLSDLTNYFISSDYLDDLKNRFFEMKQASTASTISSVQECDQKPTFNEILFSKEYAKLMTVIESSTEGSIEPKSLHETIQKHNHTFIGYEQQDSQEVLALLLDQLHEGLKYSINIGYSGTIENTVDELMVDSINNWKNNLGNKYSKIAELFFGQFINKIISLNEDNKNEMVSKTFEMFNMLNIPIYGNTLYDSLSKYFEKEVLESQYFDEKNNKYICAYKKINLMIIPKYLIIVLKRYKNNSSGNLYKSNNMIAFPIDCLDLTPYSEGYEAINSNLKLVSIGCHQGGLNGGHYYAICRHKDDKWYRCDDENIQEITIQENTRHEIYKFGYILIYEKIFL